MNIFKDKLLNRIAVGKTIGMACGLIGFFSIPYFVADVDTMFIVAILFWYITLGALIGVFGIWTHYPIGNIRVPFWIRGPLLGGRMNFILILFTYDKLALLMQSTMFSGYSPFYMIIDGLFFGLLVDYIATKYIGEGKELVK